MFLRVVASGRFAAAFLELRVAGVELRVAAVEAARLISGPASKARGVSSSQRLRLLAVGASALSCAFCSLVVAVLAVTRGLVIGCSRQQLET